MILISIGIISTAILMPNECKQKQQTNEES